MSKQTEKTTTAKTITAGVAYVKANGTTQEMLWLFGKELVTLMESLNKDEATTIKIKIARAIADKTRDGYEKPVSVKTIQNKIGMAIKCYNKFKDAKAANAYSVRELGGAKKAPKKKGKFNAVEEAGKYCDNSRAERQALINALQATL